MSTSSVLSKYLPLEKQLELTEQLINDNNLEQALEIVTMTGLDLSTNTALIETLYKRLIFKTESILFSASESHKTIQDILSEDNEFNSLLKFVLCIAVIRTRVDEFILNVISHYIYTSKTKLFEGKYFINTIKPLLSDVHDNSIEERFTEDEQIVLLLQLLETIYMADNDDSNISLDTTISTTDKCLVGLLGCNVENVALQASKLMRWRHKFVHKECCFSNKFDQSVWPCLIEIYTDNQASNWKLKNILTFFLRSLMNKEISPELVEFLQTESFWVGLQLALNHSLHEYRKLALSILKLAIQKLTATNSQIANSFTTDCFNWDPSLASQIETSWKKFVTLYEMFALDTSLNQIHAARQDVINLFNDKFIDGRWGLILFSTGLKASMESVRKYVMYLMLDVKNRSVFSLNLLLLRSTLLPPVMLAHFFKAECDDITTPHANVCYHGDLVSQLFYDILNTAPPHSHSAVLKTLLYLLIDFGTAFDPARIYASYGILRYATETDEKIIKSVHIPLLQKLFEFECEEQVFETTMKTILYKLLNYVDQEDVTATQWISCIASHLKKCECTKKHFNTSNNDYDVKYCNSWFVNTKQSVINKLGVDATFDSLCAIYLNTQLNEFKEELQGILPELVDRNGPSLIDWDSFEKEAQRSIAKLLKYGSLSDSNSNDCYALGSKIVIANPAFTSIKNSLDFDNLLKSISQHFTIEKLNFLAAICLKYDVGENCSLNKLTDLYWAIVNYFKANAPNFKVKDRTYAAFFKVLGHNTVWKNSSPEDPKKVLDLIESNIENDNNQYRGNREIVKIISSVYQQGVSVGPGVQQQCFQSLSTMWDSLSDERLVLKESELQYSLIKNLFDVNNILTALRAPDSSIAYKLTDYTKQISAFSFSKRRFLPILAQQLKSFMMGYSDYLTSMECCRWFSEIIVDVFVQDQMDQNIFLLKSVVGYFYDRVFQSGEFIPLYELVYNEPEIHAKISIVSTVTTGPNIFQRSLINYLIKDANMLISKKRIDGPEEKQRMLKWQLALLALRTVNQQNDVSFLKETTKLIISSLESEASPMVRIYKEWFIAYCTADLFTADDPSELENVLFSLLHDHTRPILVVSAEKILFLVLKAKIQTNPERFLNRFISMLIPNATSNKPLVRHFSNSLILSLWPSTTSINLYDDIKSVLHSLYINAKQTEVVGKYRSGDANVWELYKDMTLTGIFGGVIRKTTDHQPLYISAVSFKKFGNIESQIGCFPIGTDDSDKWLDTRELNNEEGNSKLTEDSSNESDEISPLQTKSGAWETVLDIDDKKSTATVKRSNIIVIASLLNLAPNLGGICRLCDVLGAELLTVDNIKIMSNPQFKKVAVTAEKWMPMKEVPVDSIASFMRMKKKEGYTLIGLEQTASSVQLNSHFNFPRKSIILLGTESRGIPGELLADIDMCLAIEQHGISKVMNVQTAAAIVVNSYSLQHM
ncbi:tRNA (guanosine(18)-2'-O)-methyltransferase [Monosporozyma unispora]